MSFAKLFNPLKLVIVWRNDLSYGMIDLVAGLVNDVPVDGELLCAGCC